MQPRIQTKNSAGADLYAQEEVSIEAGGSAIISTGYRYDISHAGRVVGRSGLAFNNDIIAFNGLIDADYRDEVKVKLFNMGKEPYTVKKGDRIAQLVILSGVETYKWFSSSARSRSGGFGSTSR